MKAEALETIVQSDVIPAQLQTMAGCRAPVFRLRIAIIFIALINVHCFIPQSANAADPVSIPNLSTWKADMLTFGDIQCAELKAGRGDIYYDAGRVFYQVRDFTNDPKWDVCAELAVKKYRDGGDIAPPTPGNPGSGGAAPWNNFSTGLRMHYERTGDLKSKNAVHFLATTQFAADSETQGGTLAHFWTQSYPGMRETSLAIINHIDDEKLGTPHRARLDELINDMLGQHDQIWNKRRPWTNPMTYCCGATEKAGLIPFWMGISMQALITYSEEYPNDTRILPAIRQAVDGLWKDAWSAVNGAFYYESTTASHTYYAALNQFIAPAYAWVYKKTGDASYRDKADTLFSEAVKRSHCSSGGDCTGTDDNGSWMYSGKQYDQLYWWSFKYIEWRLGTVDQNLPPSPPRTLRIQ